MGKIFSEFFTNFAVAWATAGLISPLFAPQNDPNIALIIILGISGSILSLLCAIILTRIYDRN